MGVTAHALRIYWGILTGEAPGMGESQGIISEAFRGVEALF